MIIHISVVHIQVARKTTDACRASNPDKTRLQQGGKQGCKILSTEDETFFELRCELAYIIGYITKTNLLSIGVYKITFHTLLQIGSDVDNLTL